MGWIGLILLLAAAALGERLAKINPYARYRAAMVAGNVLLALLGAALMVAWCSEPNT